MTIEERKQMSDLISKLTAQDVKEFKEKYSTRSRYCDKCGASVFRGGECTVCCPKLER